MNLLYILISSLFSGLIGIIVSNWYHHRKEVQYLKLQVLTQIAGNRYDFSSPFFLEGINQVFITFSKSKNVIDALQQFQEAIVNHAPNYKLAHKKFLTLLKAMCRELRIDTNTLNDSFFLEPFGYRKN